jgi:hypothetical protein
MTHVLPESYTTRVMGDKSSQLAIEEQMEGEEIKAKRLEMDGDENRTSTQVTIRYIHHGISRIGQSTYLQDITYGSRYKRLLSHICVRQMKAYTLR